MELIKAGLDDLEELWSMQVEAFADLLEKYQDHDISPGAESRERVKEKLMWDATYYYFIVENGEKVGAIRIIDKKDGSRRRISPLFIMKQHRGRGLAQKAIKLAEELHGADNWSLDTILQEPSNCHLYEKLGYKRTGKTENIKDGMDIVFYEKN